MYWLEKLIQQISQSIPDGEIVVSSGVSPSGKYHVGTLREVLTADALTRGLRRVGRKSRHIHFVDDLDPFRKIPAGIADNFGQYLGRPLCDVPSPDNSGESYADYFLKDFTDNVAILGIDMEVVRSHEQYRSGNFTEVIEKTLERIDSAKEVLVQVSGRQLDDGWSPIQVNEDGYLKKRRFISLDTQNKMLTYLDSSDKEQTCSYAHGDIKLDWRLDWPARWSMYRVAVEPFGRDHATKGGSYDTGKELVERVFDAQPPIPVPYHFINRAGETKKMSKSAGNTVTVSELLQVLPPEIVRFFILKLGPEKQLFFDQQDGVIRIIDEYAELLAKPEKSDADQWLLDMCDVGSEQVISNIPFSHLVASYQASLKDAHKTIELIKRTEHAMHAEAQTEIIKRELKYIENWLNHWAPESIKFELRQSKPTDDEFSEKQKTFFTELSRAIESAPETADGQWFHQAIYQFKDSLDLEPKELFRPLYQLLINKDAGPRAGWFLSLLPRDWLIQRLRFET